ncbi:MAG TPA: hypothetical protein VFX45_05910 [Solirubrobacterales bacterium]|nr:hypothetical protein [Solirubrobacterales bacterium]
MGSTTFRLGAGFSGLVVLAILVAATTAGAIPVSGEQFSVSGEQKIVSEKGSKMSGGLIGSWKITSFKVVASKPVFRGKGTESFSGCIDRKLDGSCAGDPSGTMKFSFRYWAKLDSEDAVQLGTCAHPVTGGTGAFAGATGFLMMVDTPIKKPPFLKTEYEGVITLSGPTAAARPSAVQTPC